MTVATRALDEADVVVVPGAGLGEAGEWYVRFALTLPEERTREAVERLARLHW
jgi:LL-diaminopimelate aminotransferase